MISDRVHLLVLTTSYPNRSNPASGVFVRRLLINLPEAFSPTVITPDTDRKIAFDKGAGIRIRPFRYAPRHLQVIAHKPGGLLAAFRRNCGYLILLPGFFLTAALRMFCEIRKADLIHAQWAPNGVMAGLIGRLMRRPVITTLRGIDFNWARSSFFFRLLVRWCLCLNRKVIAVSHEMADLLTEWFPQHHQKVLFISNGVDVTESDGVLQKPMDLFTVAVIGNLIPEKRVEVIINAFRWLAQHVPKTRLLVVGDGPERRNLEMLADRLGLKGKVTFSGVMEPEGVREILPACHALVLASENEGRPNVVLEAMAAGVPVVAADIGPVRELIGLNERGLLFSPCDVEQLVSQLVLLSKDSATGDRLAQNAREWLREQGLTWQQTAAAYAAVYSQVLAEYRRGKSVCAE